MGDWDLPSIDVSLGPRTNGPFSNYDKCIGIDCFQRDLSLDSNKRKSSVRHTPGNLETSQSAKEPPQKKRKLKPARQVGLDKRLEEL